MAWPKRLADEKKEWTRKAIQQSAKKVFFEKGYADATIEEIARLAGVAKGSIYLYFQAKDDLYLSLMIPVLEEIRESLTDFQNRFRQGEYPRCNDLIQGFYHHYERAYRFDSDGIRIIQAFQQGNLIAKMSKKTREELNRVARENFRTARSILSAAMAKRIIAPMNPVLLSDIFWSIFIGVVQLEESKFRATKKNHLEGTLNSAFSILAKGLCPIPGIRRSK
jgi:AcrR family transcriptional regulator